LLTASKAKKSKFMEDETSMYKLVCSSRFDKMESALNTQNKELIKIKAKIFNGYEQRFNDMDKKIDGLKKDNDTNHKEIRNSIDGMNKFIRRALIGLIGLLLTLMLGAGINFVLSYKNQANVVKTEHVIKQDLNTNKISDIKQ